MIPATRLSAARPPLPHTTILATSCLSLLLSEATCASVPMLAIVGFLQSNYP